MRKTDDADNNRTLYGCNMKPSPVIDKFISEEQRNRVKHTR